MQEHGREKGKGWHKNTEHSICICIWKNFSPCIFTNYYSYVHELLSISLAAGKHLLVINSNQILQLFSFKVQDISQDCCKIWFQSLNHILQNTKITSIHVHSQAQPWCNAIKTMAYLNVLYHHKKIIHYTMLYQGQLDTSSKPSSCFHLGKEHFVWLTVTHEEISDE